MKYYLLLLLLFIPISVLASESNLLTINNCFNVSVHSYLSQGNYTPISFKNCNKLNINDFECKCRDYSQPFKLVMSTDSKYAERFYKLDIEYSTYELKTFSGVKIVKDRGTFSTIDGYMDEGKDNIISIPIYIDREKIVEKNITITNCANTIYVPTEINTTFFFENTSKIDNLTSTIDSLKLESARFSYRMWVWIVISCCIFIGMIIEGLFLYSVW